MSDIEAPCPMCGVWVADKPRHYWWHRAVQPGHLTSEFSEVREWAGIDDKVDS